MSDDSKQKKNECSNLFKLHLCPEAKRSKYEDNRSQLENDALVEEKLSEECHITRYTRKHNFTGSIKNARKKLFPNLGTSTKCHQKVPRQSTIDIGDMKSMALKAHKNQNIEHEMETGNTREDMSASNKNVMRPSLEHLDLAELSHRRTATCEELEKFTIDHVHGHKSLYAMRKDLLTCQRLKEWSFI